MKFDLTEIECYRDADEKLQELDQHRDGLRRKGDELRSQLSHDREHRDEVDALLHGDVVSTAVVSRNEIAQIEHELRVRLDAIELQQQTVQQMRCVASAEIRQRALSEYRAIVKKTAHVLASLREIAAEEYEFRTSLIAGGVILDNPLVLPFGDCGQPLTEDGHRQDAIGRWEKQARDAGMI